MKSTDIYILGAGGMARETYQIYKDLNKSNLIKGFIINIKNKKQTHIYRIPVRNEDVLSENYLLICGIGTPKKLSK